MQGVQAVAEKVMSPAVEAARRILGRYWDKALPVNPSAILYAMGVRIVYDPNLSASGCLDLQDDGRPVIRISPRDSFMRQRFTLFYELGRYVFEHGPVALDSSRNHASGEVMANQFAAEMILPSEAVFLYANGDYSLVRMAQLFNVSEQAMRIRLERLGIL